MAKKASALTLVTSLDPTDLIVASPANGTDPSVAIAFEDLGPALSMGTLRRTFTNAEILAFPTTLAIPMFTVIPGKIIYPSLVALKFNWVADYTNLDGGARFQYGWDATGLGGATIKTASLVIAAGHSTFMQTSVQDDLSDELGPLANYEGQSFYLIFDPGAGVGNLTGGDDDNTLEVILPYYVL